MKPLAYSVDDVVRMLPIGRSTVYEEMKAGRLKYRAVGRRRIILADDLDAWLEALPIAPPPASYAPTPEQKDEWAARDQHRMAERRAASRRSHPSRR